jgi:glycine dehydrogenase subunit 1
MSDKRPTVHPYIPNSVPEIREEMLREIGVSDAEKLYAEIPETLRCKRPLNLPEPFPSEYELKKHVEGILGRNRSCDEYLNFLGAGCYQHHVPSVCDEVVNRGEFLTAYAGCAYSDLGRLQASFEYASMITELLGMDVTGMPTFDGSSAASTSIRMTARITGRPEALVPEAMSPQRLMHMKNYCRSTDVRSIKTVAYDPATGLIDLDDLKSKLGPETAGVYIENPNYLGIIETQGAEIANLAHEQGALLAVGVNPMSLGALSPPGEYGADIACGDAQPLGVHMSYGGGSTGFIAVRDVDRHIGELPMLMVSVADLVNAEGFGFSVYARPERLSYLGRENAKEYTGTATALWGIANAVYMALMGPQGMKDIGETILQKSHYAKKITAHISGVKMPLKSAHFNEFVVNFDATGKSVADINRALLDRKIFGGKDLTAEFPALGKSALYCISEIHSKDDIDRLAAALKEVVS